jgi:hypothetical protein
MSNVDLNSFQKTNLIIWSSIVSGMIILSIVVVILDQFNTFVPVKNAYQINQIIFMIAVVFAGAILVFKRSFYLPHKVVSPSIRNKKAEKEKAVLNRLRRNYLIIWSLAEGICLVGFINYVFTANWRSYLIFIVVSTYAMLINLPRNYQAEKCLELLSSLND